MNLSIERERFTISFRRLRRGRRLLTYLAWRSVGKARSDCDRDARLHRIIERGHKRGLWSKWTNENAIRYSMIRRFYDLDESQVDWVRYVVRYNALPGGWARGEHKSCKFKLARKAS